jgi:aspartate-semialdehyde dehydrogenase
MNSNSTKLYSVAVIGATGAVGKMFLQKLEEENFPVGSLHLFASDQSAGKQIQFLNQEYKVQSLSKEKIPRVDFAFFSSGDEISQTWAQSFVDHGAWVIDNSAAFRMQPDIDLVVPEVNGDLLSQKKARIIANPNCSTIQLVLPLSALQKKFGIQQVIVSSYQAVSGAGQPGLDELQQQRRGQKSSVAEVFARPIDQNCIPQIGSLDEMGLSSEERKVQSETKKILRDSSLHVSAMTVRIPIQNVHSECVWVRLKSRATKQDVIHALQQQQGLVVAVKDGDYPTALDVDGKDPVFVGRIHQDSEDPYLWKMWVVADNLRKGAATNGLQIAQRILRDQSIQQG